jgi:hypothetical protein
LWSISLDALTTPVFFSNLVLGDKIIWLKKLEAELKNIERASPNTPMALTEEQIYLGSRIYFMNRLSKQLLFPIKVPKHPLWHWIFYLFATLKCANSACVNDMWDYVSH